MTEDVATIADVYAAKANRTDDAQLLARCVNGEARGEPYIGQVAVAAVILNRVKHPSFPNTLAGVIYQPRAFTAVADGQINVPIDPNSTVYKACQDALNGWDPTGGAIYYYNPAKTTSKWIYSRQVVKTIGKHKFAK
jgi:N-acetylmuramoyl-L-alanine amidase